MIDLAAALALNPASWTQVETVDEFIFLSEHPATERSFAAALDAVRAEAPA